MKHTFFRWLLSKRVYVAVFALALALFGVSTSQAACRSNDTGNDIMECGFTSAADFAQKAEENAEGDLDTLYSRYGLSQGEYDRFARSAKAGTVSPDGDVTVDGTVVGINAKSLGRNEKASSSPVTIGGTTYHESEVGDVTTRDNDVMVLMDDEGQAEFVVMNICGNPIKVEKVPGRGAGKEPAVTISKKVHDAEKKTVTINTNFTYQLVVRNTGDVTLEDLTVTDTPADGITLVSSSDGSVTDNEWEYTFDEALEPGDSRSFTLTAKVAEYSADELKNTACVETPTIPETNPDDCDDATVTTNEPEKIEVCEIATGEIITIDETDKDATKHAAADSIKCKVKVCDTNSNDIVTISRKRFAANQNRYTEDESKCQTTPPVATPTLPSTGTGEILLSVAGAGSIAGAGYYWRASRREIIAKILGSF